MLKSTPVSVRLTPLERAALHRAAEECDMTLSQLFRAVFVAIVSGDYRPKEPAA